MLAATSTLVCTNANGTITLNLNEAKRTVTMNDGRNAGAEAAVFEPEKITVSEQNGALLFKIDRVTGDFSLTENGKTFIMYSACRAKESQVLEAVRNSSRRSGDVRCGSKAVITSRLARSALPPIADIRRDNLECPLRARNRLPPIAALVGDRYSIFGDTAESTLYAASGRRIPLSANHPPARRSRYSQPPSARGG